MIKAVDSSWVYDDMPQTTLIPSLASGRVSRDWWKQASCWSAEDLSDLKIDPGFQGLRVIALGDYEYTGLNANGDGFTERGGTYRAENGKPIDIKVGNVQTHPTFVTHGRVYRNHKNSDPKYSYGPVLKSAHNNRMKRVELIIAVPEREFRDELQKIASGRPVGWSMACSIKHDICLSCGNVAKTRAEYCKHARDELTLVKSSGHQVGVLNDGMTYFDISQVFRPADRIAWTLAKVADASASALAHRGSAELAERLGLTVPRWLKAAESPKLATVRRLIEKMAQFEKELPLTVDPVEACAVCRPPAPRKDVEAAMKLPKNRLFDQLAGHKICLSLPDFIELMTGNRPDPSMAEEATGLVPNLFQGLLQNSGAEEWAEVAPFTSLDEADTNLESPADADILQPLEAGYSLADPCVRRRTMIMVIQDQPKTKNSQTIRRMRSCTDPSEKAIKMAYAYAGFQLSMLAKHPDDPMLGRRLVLGNYSN